MTGAPSKIGAELSDEATQSFLESNRHGVLSMGVGDRGYGLPVAYRYEGSDHILLGFVEVPESKKRAFADTTEEVTLTVFDFEDVDSWESVIVTGTIHRVSEADIPEQFSTLFFAPIDDSDDSGMYDFDDYERVLYELRIADISGRHSGDAPEE